MGAVTALAGISPNRSRYHRAASSSQRLLSFTRLRGSCSDSLVEEASRRDAAEPLHRVNVALHLSDELLDQRMLHHEPAGAIEDVSLNDELVNGLVADRRKVHARNVDMRPLRSAGGVGDDAGADSLSSVRSVALDESARLRLILRLLQNLPVAHDHLVRCDEECAVSLELVTALAI
uniref:Uncharacterized protein n=1 Tax=Chrysotila carterae TaxID=13221 RepID=A0A7S4F1K2_CHRCT